MDMAKRLNSYQASKKHKKYRDIHQLKLACCIVLDRVGNYTNGKVRLKNVTLILPPLGEIGSLIT